MTLKTLLLAATFGLGANLALAQTHDMASMADPALQELMAPMDAMMSAMPMHSTGSPDADFLLMMIPHHQAAIDMARVVLATGTDPATRALAQAIIAAQEGEITAMQAMLATLGFPQPAAD